MKRRKRKGQERQEIKVKEKERRGKESLWEPHYKPMRYTVLLINKKLGYNMLHLSSEVKPKKPKNNCLVSREMDGKGIDVKEVKRREGSWRAEDRGEGKVKGKIQIIEGGH